MKRIGSALVVLALALTGLTPALAAEPDQVDYEALQAQKDALYEQIDALYEQVSSLETQMTARYIGYYEQYGDMADWDDEMWALSDTWSDAEWQGYWAGEEAAMESGDWWAETKAEMGMPFPEGLNVEVNGTYLEQEPLALDGVTYLPAEFLLNALGLEKTQVAAVDMDGVPCLPIRAVAEEAGCEVEWDGSFALITVWDWEKIAAEIDRDFTIFNSILQADRKAVDPEKTYSSKGTVTLTGTLYGEEKNDTAALTVDMDALVAGDGSAMDMTYTLGADPGGFQDLLAACDPEVQEILALLDGADFQMRMYADGGLYCRSNRAEYLDGAYPNDQWIGPAAYDFGALYAEMLEQMKELTVGKLIVMMAQGSGDPGGTLETRESIFRLLLGDDAFTTKTVGSTTTYTCEMDTMKLAKRAAALGLFTLEDMGSLFGNTGIPTAHYELVMKQTGEKPAAISMKGSLSWNTVRVEFEVKGDNSKSESYFALEGRYIGKLEVTSESAAAVTAKTVPAPPADAMDPMEWMELSYEDEGVSILPIPEA